MVRILIIKGRRTTLNMDNPEQTTWEWDKGPLGRLVKVAYISMRRELEGLLRPIGITHTQWSALGIIHQFPGITSSEMELILMIERPSVTSLINGMVNKGMAIRKDHPNDARYKQIYLTDEGTDLALKTQHLTQEVDLKVRDGLSVREYESLKKLLIQVVHTLDKK